MNHVSRRNWLVVACRAFCFVLLLGTMGLATAAEVFGTIELVDGPARIFDAQGQSRLVHEDDRVSEGDTIVTGRDAEVHIRTEDHGFVSVRSNTKFRIDSYSARADSGDKSVTSLLVGALRSITGWIGKTHPEAYVIKSPTATIGVRGTDHETVVILPPEPGQTPMGTPGTYDKVNQGSTVMKSDKGEVILQPNQASFTPHDGAVAPKALDAIPAFYRPSKHEKRIEERRETLSKEIQRHHAARQKEQAEAKQPHRVAPVPKSRLLHNK